MVDVTERNMISDADTRSFGGVTPEQLNFLRRLARGENVLPPPGASGNARMAYISTSKAVRLRGLVLFVRNAAPAGKSRLNVCVLTDNGRRLLAAADRTRPAQEVCDR